MITLASPIAIPTISRVRLDRILLDTDSEIVLLATVGGFRNAAPFVHGQHEIIVRNGMCVGIRGSSSAQTLDSIVEPVSIDIPAGLDSFWTAVGTGTRAQRLAAAELWLSSQGLLPSGS